MFNLRTFPINRNKDIGAEDISSKQEHELQ